MIILTEACPRHLLQFMGALIGLVIATAGVLGPVLGGVLTEYASWRWVFWIKYVSCAFIFNEVRIIQKLITIVVRSELCLWPSFC